MQYSVFRCSLSAQEKMILIMALTELIHHKEDRVMIIRVGPTRGNQEKHFEYLGRREVVPPQKARVI